MIRSDASLAVHAWAVLLIVALLAACRADPDARHAAKRVAVDRDSQPASPSSAGQEWFTDAAEGAGLEFLHVNGMSGQLYFPEIMPPGVGLVDYDGDGDLDVYLVQGQSLDASQGVGDATRHKPGHVPLGGRLFRNDLMVRQDGSRTLHFTDVTKQGGIRSNGYGMGVTAGDFDNDGFVDLYLTNFGRNQLFRNNRDGTFADVSEPSGTDDPGWSVSAAFLDYDRDGWLDLFVGHYVHYSVETNKKCFSVAGLPDYCPPQVYRPQPSRLYHNNRDGTFTDVTPSALVGSQFGPTLGVVAADLNGDGWTDTYVANDGQENQLWINQRDGTFKNTGLLSGVALTADGKAEASMGVDAGDFDNDGDEDLIVTELTGQGTNLYVNDGSGMFEDHSARTGLDAATLPFTGFGTAWLDFDNDGWLDILAVNGAIEAAAGRKDDVFPYGQSKLLFRNLGNGFFRDVTREAGRALQLLEVSRGAAFGDVDNDGDVDVLVGNNAGQVRLLIDNVGNRNHWLGLRLVGERTSRDMIGARVMLEGRSLIRRARADGSYASTNDPRVLLGLGESAESRSVRVQWPSGREERWTDLAVDRYVTLREGSGK